MKETGLNMRQLYLRKKLNFILLIFCLCHIGAFTSKTNCAIKSPAVPFSFKVPKKFVFFGWHGSCRNKELCIHYQY